MQALQGGADALEVEREDGYDWVYANQGNTGISIAQFPSSSAEARELLDNLYSAARRPVRIVIAGHVRAVKVSIRENFGEDAFDVRIQIAPKAGGA